MANKELYATLPPPDVNGVQNPPAAILLTLGGNPGLPPQDQFLMGTGGTGLPYTEGPDTRIPNVTNLLPGPFQLTGPNLPFDAYAGDTVHWKNKFDRAQMACDATQSCATLSPQTRRSA